MTYQVHVVHDDELPEGIARVLVQRVRQDPLLILSETSAATWKRVEVSALQRDDGTLVLHELAGGP